MIVYGIGNKLLKEAPIENFSCTNCKHPSSVISIYQRYFDLFWIPTFPLGKKIVLVCPNCEHVVEEKEFPEEFKKSSKLLKSSLPTPKYMFTGLILIMLFMSYIGYETYADDYANEQLDAQYMSNPMEGDVYALYDEDEPSEFKYYFYKIAWVDGDSIYFNVNDYYYDGITTILEPEDGFYEQFEIAFHKAEVKDMYEMDEIRSIYRDYGEWTNFNSIISSDSIYDENYLEEADTVGN